MVHTKLVLIEGLPGAGKTTTTAHLGEYLQKQGIACRWYLEEDDPHPIACFDFALESLSQKMIPLWRSFTEQAIRDEIVTIIESRLWQNTALFMYMSEYPVVDIIEFHRQVWRVLTPLSPTLVYLHQDNAEDALSRLYACRGDEWMEWALHTTSRYQWFRSRGLDDFAGWVQFFREWLQVAEQLYRDWPYQKTKIEDPHDDWTTTYLKICRFMQVGRRGCAAMKLMATASHIDYSDVPPLPDTFFKRAKVWRPQPKVTVTVELDADILEWFKAEAEDGEARMQTALRLYVEAHKAYRQPQVVTR